MRMVNVSITKCALLAGVALLLGSCNGTFSGIYDNDVAGSDVTPEFGFVGDGETPGTKRIYVDASSYTVWNYLNFHTSEASVVEIEPGEEAEPKSWDLALHRYDVKTNGGKVMATSLTSLADAAKLTSAPAGTWVADEWTTDKISIDMSHMMDGYIIYAESFYNPVLSGWVNVDTSEMPPIYTQSHNVYIVEFADGSHAAIKLMDFMDASGVKGFMTADYVYPLKF